MQNKSMIFSAGIIAAAAIIVACIFVFGNSKHDLTTQQLVSKLQTKVSHDYNAKAGIDIYFMKLNKNKAKSIANDLSGKLKLPNPKDAPIFKGSKIHDITSNDKTKKIGVEAEYTKK